MYLVTVCWFSSFWWNSSNLGFPGISRRTHGGNGLEFCMLMYPYHLQKGWYYCHCLLIFLLLVPLWLCKTGQFEVSRHFLENAWEEWPEFWHADVSQPPSELIRFWSCSVDFPHFGAPLTWWNWSYLVFPGIIWRTPGSKCWGESGGIYSMFCVEFCPVFHVKCSHIWWWNFV